MLQELLNDDLKFFDSDSRSYEELFESVSEFLEERGYVNEKYQQAILNREKQFPTGLITKHLNIGLPHSDPEYIHKPFVSLVRTKNPIQIYQMGDNQLMDADVFFFLGITDPKNQVKLLSEIMEFLENEEEVKLLVEDK